MHRTRRSISKARRVLPFVVLALVAALVAGCGSDPGNSKLLSDANNGTLTIGVHFDEPGLGLKDVAGKMTGFDIDVARYVAGQLGVDPSGITWKDTPSGDREKVLENGDVDLVVGTYSITDKRKKVVSFAGPYFIAGQDLLVRMNETGITGPQALNGRKLCSVKGSTSAAKVKEKYANGVQLAEYDRYSGCVNALLSGMVDAVTTDNTILAGYVAEFPEVLKLVDKPFSTERYGVGLAKGDAAGQAKVADALQKMMDSGAWKDSLQRNLGPADIPIPTPPKITER